MFGKVSTATPLERRHKDCPTLDLACGIAGLRDDVILVLMFGLMGRLPIEKIADLLTG